MKKAGFARRAVCLIGLLSAAGLSACSSSEDFSDMLRAQGSELNEQADMWSEGHRLVKDGNDLMEEGRDLVAEGHRKIARGQDMVTEGDRLTKEVERSHANRVATAKLK